MRATLVAALLATLLVSGCSTRTVFVCPDLPVLSRPEVPWLTPEQVASVDGDIWAVLDRRERLLVGYSMELESVIEGIRAQCN